MRLYSLTKVFFSEGVMLCVPVLCICCVWSHTGGPGDDSCMYKEVFPGKYAGRDRHCGH